MGLKQSIVVVNEYTVKNKGGGGSRGGTPGDYVLRYMGRDGATEASVTSQLALDNYVQGYMARDTAAEAAGGGYEPQPRHRHRRDGVAFGGKNASMSHDELVRSSKDIQAAFDSGKTVMKTVISFDEAYLRENGIIPDDFVFEKRGDYRGNIDQMKLRYAIMNGMEHLGHDYDDLRYVGVIQVDTAHVHCHLAMVDMGSGQIAQDGTQRGKIAAPTIAKLRRGIDLYLDEQKEVQFMASAAGLDRREMQTAMKRYTYEQVLLYGAPQRIMTALPDDQRQWRASSNARNMRQANKICRDYVESIFAKPDSGISGAMDNIRRYADARQRREGLSEEERLELVTNGREKLVQNCMNSVYATLRQVPKDSRSTSTPFLDAVAVPMPVPSHKNDVQDFVYRSSAYQSRFKKHRDEEKRFDSFAKDYEKAQETGMTDPAAQALYEYFLVEREYQAKCAGKYGQMLFLAEPDDDYADEYVRVADEARRLNAMQEFMKDSSVRGMKAENAEAYGQERYGIYGGRFGVLDRDYFQRRVDKYAAKYESDAESLRQRLAPSGLSIEENGDGTVKITKKPQYPFEDVKGLDLHDIRGDFSGTLEFSGDVRMAYMDMARRRIEAYDKACAYLDASGQGALKGAFDTQDIRAMRNVLETLEANEPVEAVERPLERLPQKQTLRLDKSMHQYISRIVKTNVVSLEAAEAMNLREYLEAPEDTGLE